MQQWVAALRSGEYLQGRGKLERVEEDGTSYFCCLGVLCKLAEQAGIVNRRAAIDQGIVWFSYSDSMPPSEVYIWSGLSYVRAVKYAHMNDSDHKTFNEIADAVEADHEPA